MRSSSSAHHLSCSVIDDRHDNSPFFLDIQGNLIPAAPLNPHNPTVSADEYSLLMAEPLDPYQDTSCTLEEQQKKPDFQPGPQFDGIDFYQPPVFHDDLAPSPTAWTINTEYSLHPVSAAQMRQPFQQHRNYHRRALSNSSMGSFPPDSPYSRASSIQYPAPVPTSSSPSSNNHVSGVWDDQGTGSGPAVNHLPTPSNTPTRESFMERIKNRRTSSAQISDPAMLAAQNSMKNSNIVSFGPQQRPDASDAGRDWNENHTTVGNGDANGKGREDLVSIDWLEQCLQSGNDTAPRNIPKFDRTISDICQDELYNPSSAMITPPQPTRQINFNSAFLSPQSLAVNERVQAAQKARSASPFTIPRDNSPFRQNSPMAPTCGHLNDTVRTAAGVREQQKRESDALAYQQHHQPLSTTQPSTISPKDAFPEQPEPEEDNMPSLFPQTSNQSTATDGPSYGPHNANAPTDFNFAATGPPYSGFANAMMAGGMPTTYMEFQHEQLRPSNSTAEPQRQYHGVISQNNALQSTKQEDEDSLANVEKPANATASTGTYSCTYHGCTERFESQAQLQRHKREGHRSTNSQAADMTQAGPHRCTRINPSTGRPCNSVFSRPYDLTRHEQSLHAPVKKKLRCPYCTDEKLFSRADALTRHSRVVHATQAWPGKSRRKMVR